MKNKLINDKFSGAFVCSAIGDALGWPNEFRAKSNTENISNGDYFIEWKRTCGGRYYSHEEIIKAGEYSDDTQLIIATARSLMYGAKWNKQFTRNELPFWLEYERGAGSATKSSAKIWKKSGQNPWDYDGPNGSCAKYFNAGGNGVAMRILPHLVSNLPVNPQNIIKDVIRNGMYTHGHPRAIIGATCYAFALYVLLNLSSTLGYGELIDIIIQNQNVWGNVDNIPVTDLWMNNAYLCLGDYTQLWKDSVKKLTVNLQKIRKALNKGAIDFGNDILYEIGCFDKKVNGAGDIAVISALYLFSKYASNPRIGIIEAAYLFGADTDTIASMVGGLMGMLHGTEWIPNEWRVVQDYKFLYNLPQMIMDTQSEKFKEIIPKLTAKELFEKSQLGFKDFVSPIGKLHIERKISNRTNVNNIKINTVQTQSEFGQTLYFKNIKRITRAEQYDNQLSLISIEPISKISKSFKLDINDLEMLTDPFISKVTFGKVIKIITLLIETDKTHQDIAKELKANLEIVKTLSKYVR